MSLPRYPEYKDSGVEWLGPVPAHWQVLALSRVLQAPVTDGPHLTPTFLDEGIPFLSVDGIQDGELVFEGCRFISQSDHIEFSRKAAPRVNDILMGKAASIGKIARVKTTEEFSIWSPLALIRVSDELCLPAFAEYALKSPGVQAQVTTLANSNTQFNIGMKDIPKLRLSLPPLSEQTAIATFLDRETGKIDALITEQEKLLALLAEKRQATISHAVTKGLNPDVPMKDSGVAWLGEVPEHWRVTRLKYATSLIVDCPHETPTYDEDGPYKVIRTADVSEGRLTTCGMYSVSESEYINRIRRQSLLRGDIVYGREGERWGFAAQVPESDSYCLGQRMMQFRAVERTCSRYLMWQLNAVSTYRQGQMDTVGATSPHVNVGTIRNYVLAEPPHSEQQEISAFLDAETARLDALDLEASRAIALLKERRSALIAAAVTGQIDVRCLVTELEAA